MLAVAGETANEESVFVPPLLLETPPQAAPTIVKAIVEIVHTERRKKRRLDFIHSLFELMSFGAGRRLRRGPAKKGCPNREGIGTFDCLTYVFFFW